MHPSIYINLEDDVSRIAERLKRVTAQTVVLVCPKKCFLFSDGINLKLLKKQADLLGKEVFILTMDERGQAYAREAGFPLKFLAKRGSAGNFSDIKVAPGKLGGPVLEAQKEKTAAVEEIWEEKEIVEVRQTQKGTAQVAYFRSETLNASSPQVSVADAFFPREIEERHKLKAEKKYNQKVVTVFVAASLIIILAVVFVVLPKATVVIYPKVEPLTRDLEISAGAAIAQPDVSKLLLPATKVDETLELSNNFQSQGKQEVGNKASGTVKIYNFAKLPLNLKAKTTTLTAGSKNYSLAADVVGLRPTVYKNAKTKEVDENSLGASITVVAAAGGEDYNLPAGIRLEITNQVFGSKPQLLFAKTDAPVTGGTSRYLSVVSDQDISGSQSALTDQAVNKIQEKLKTENLILPQNGYISQVLQFTTDKPAGTQSPNFQADLKIKITGLAINPETLKKLIYDRISQTLAGGLDLSISPDSRLTEAMKTLASSNELGVLSAHFEGNAVPNINLSEIAGSLVGKSQNQVSEILKSKPEIDRIEITLAPSWQKTFPWFASKIEVKFGESKGN